MDEMTEQQFDEMVSVLKALISDEMTVTFVYPPQDGPKTVSANWLTVEQHHKMAGEAGVVEIKTLVKHIFNLDDKTVNNMSMPDYNQLKLIADGMIMVSAEMLLNVDDFNVDAPMLLVQFNDVLDRKVTHYAIRPPTVKSTEAMNKLTDSHDKTLYITSVCTGIDKSDLIQMSMPDWNHLQGRLVDFLTQAADYFRRATSS